MLPGPGALPSGVSAKLRAHLARELPALAGGAEQAGGDSASRASGELASACSAGSAGGSAARGRPSWLRLAPHLPPALRLALALDSQSCSQVRSG